MRRHTIPGLRVCRTCGHLYTPSALLCPVCFPAGGANLALAKAMQQTQAAPVVDGVTPVGPVFVIPAWPTYPAWLKEFSRRCPFNNGDLECLMSDPAQSQLTRATAAALYCFRRGEPIPDSVDLAAIETEYNELRRRGN